MSLIFLSSQFAIFFAQFEKQFVIPRKDLSIIYRFSPEKKTLYKTALISNQTSHYQIIKIFFK
jgi:hypothetical protein